jgi:hypothetical protein
MRSRTRHRRYLGLLAPSSVTKGLVSAKAATVTPGGTEIPAEFTAHQYLVFLLHVAAELEHVLMVEYLYAAFSLGGEGVTASHSSTVARWQETILGVAKEEMGHLMTVQNLLRCLGGPLNLDREDYPWDSEFYPFPFRLEPLTRQSLAKYIVAESPEHWDGKEADEIRALANEGTGDRRPHRVGELYEKIRVLLAEPGAIRNADFRESTYPFQANWDEWGRGYQRGARGAAMGASMPGTPDVLLLPVVGRTDALGAIKAVTEQGEATPTANEQNPSHFARFLRIYREFPRDGAWAPTRAVPVNPTVSTQDPSEDGGDAQDTTPITHPVTRLWASLFNVRYRMLLTNLLHSFDYPGNLDQDSAATPRGLLVNATFGEMYNLRALSTILMQTPLAEDDALRMAGPPFQMPYTVRLPHEPVDRWRQHTDLLEASMLLADRLLDVGVPHQEYLQALRQVDTRVAAGIRTILDGLRTAASV